MLITKLSIIFLLIIQSSYTVNEPEILSDSLYVHNIHTNVTEIEEVIFYSREEEIRINRNNTLFFYFFIFSGILLVIFKILYPGYAKEVLRGISSPKYLELMYREGLLNFSYSQLILDLTFIFNFSLILAYIIERVELFEVSKIILIISVLYISKIMVIKYISSIFFGRLKVNPHVLEIVFFIRITGIILLFFNFLIFSLPNQFFNILLTITIITILLIYIAKLIRIYFGINRNTNFGKIYYFLYLCIIEMVPFLLILKQFY